MRRRPPLLKNQNQQSPSSEQEEVGTKALVVYFSAIGNTMTVAETLAEMQGADLYGIMPQQPYTKEDLNYNDRSNRSTVEQNDENVRLAISGSIDHIDDYDMIYVGYPKMEYSFNCVSYI